MTEKTARKVAVWHYPDKIFSTPGVKTGRLIVVADIFRATTTICAALHAGVREIIPVQSVEEAGSLAKKGFVVAGERKGVKLSFAQFDNSPSAFSNIPAPKTLYLTTSNGTAALKAAWLLSENVVAGAFVNFLKVAGYILNSGRDAAVLCAGDHGEESPEDMLFAGKLAGFLIKNGFQPENREAESAVDLWNVHGNDPKGFLQNTRHFKNLMSLNREDDINLALTNNLFDLLPVFDGTGIYAPDTAGRNKQNEDYEVI
ncbi:MAG: 2-phosphosulfolactate phosphatase family protein [Bacteroidales bacterium]